jgi:hypothetical protein
MVQDIKPHVEATNAIASFLHSIYMASNTKPHEEEVTFFQRVYHNVYTELALAEVVFR